MVLAGKDRPALGSTADQLWSATDGVANVMLDLAHQALDAASEADWWSSVADAVCGPLFAALVMTVNMFNAVDLFGWFRYVFPVPVRERIPVHSAMDDILTREHPFSAALRNGPVHQPMKVSDLVSERQWRSSTAFGHMRELTTGTFHMVLPIPCPAPYAETLSIVRADRDFDAVEVARAARLQSVIQLSVLHLRHVEQRRQLWGPLCEADATVAAQALGLTPRERAVLDLLATGATTEVVALRLGIGRNTVYKHEHHVYRKLGVHDRLSAVLRAHRLGLAAAGPVLRTGSVSLPPLTRRETDALHLMSTGMTNAEMGDTMGISAKTVDVHVGRVLHKLDARTRTEAVTLGFRAGVLH